MRSFFGRFSKTQVLVWLFFIFWISYFAYFWTHAIFLDKQGNFVAGHLNVWGDWAAHFTMTFALYQRGPFIQSPFLIGQAFTYPFFADLLSAWLLHAGVSFSAAFLIPSFLCSILLIASLFWLYKLLWNSARVAVVACFIFLLNGGTGFVVFLQELLHSPQPLNILLNPPHEYTKIDQLGIQWMSVINSLMIPQRAFLLGFPIGLLALVGILSILHSHFSQRRQKIYFLLIGLVIGTLPIIHTHTFLALFVILAVWSVSDIWQNRATEKSVWRRWAILALGAALIGIPLLKYFILRNFTQHFFQWDPGWLANDYHLNWLVFWWRNWGVTPLVAGVGWILMIKKQSTRKNAILLLPFWLLFILINLFLFQPYDWDNTKLLAWSAVGVAGLAAFTTGQLWEMATHQPKKIKVSLQFLAMLLFVVMTFSGGIDAYRTLRISLHSYVMYSATDLQLARWVEQHTPVDSIWLTSDEHNHWLYNLTGRQTLMAYPGWLWTYGYDYQPTEAAVNTMFEGGDEAQKLLEQYHVQYIVVGPSERTNFMVNDDFFEHHFPIVYQLGATTLYQTHP